MTRTTHHDAPVRRRAARRAMRLLAGLLALGLVAAACSDDGGPDDTAGAAEPATETETDGELVGLTATPGAHNVLSARLTVEASAPVQVDVVARSDDHEVVVPRTAASAAAHEIPVVGLRAEREYELAATIVDESGAEVGTGTTTFETGELPEWFVDFELDFDPERTSPGYTAIETFPIPRPETPEDEEDPLAVHHVYVLDEEGEVVGYYQLDGVNDFSQTPRGTFSAVYFPWGVREMDPLGDPVGDWAAAPRILPHQDLEGLDENPPETPVTDDAIDVTADWIDLRNFHHEAFPLDNGNFLALSTTLHEPTQAQRDALCPGDENEWLVLSDVAVEFEPDGTVVRTWDEFDVMDFTEIPGGEICSTQGQVADDIERDWNHANAVIHDPERDAVIFSNRHTSTIVAMDYGEGEGPQTELRWIIGGDGGTIPLDGDVPRYQHAPELQDDGSILFYDNGNGRAGTDPDGDDPPYSRAALYEIDDAGDDPSQWSARQVWEHRLDTDDGEPVYAEFVGDADRLPNGNVLVDHGGIPRPTASLLEGEFNHARIVEVVPDDDGGEVVWDLRMGSADRGAISYRADRFETFYWGPDWER